MTISADTIRRTGVLAYRAGGSYSFNFRIFDTTQVSVVVADSSGVESTLTSSEYSVTLNSNGTGTVTLGSVVSCDNPVSVVLLSNVPISQEIVLENQGGFYPETLNDAYDKLTAICQQLKEEIDRAIQVPPTSTMTSGEQLSQLLSIASNANSYAQQANALYLQTKSLTDSVEKIKDNVQVVAGSIASLNKIAEKETVTDEDTGETSQVYANLNAIRTDARNITDIITVANNLNGVVQNAIDCGYVTDDTEEITTPEASVLSTIIGMNDTLKSVADNIATITAVSTMDATAIQNAVDSINEIQSTNYEQVASEV